jgi:hypothetical protein
MTAAASTGLTTEQGQPGTSCKLMLTVLLLLLSALAESCPSVVLQEVAMLLSRLSG